MEDGVEVLAGLDLGREEAPSAICRLGRGLGGFSALAEAGAEDSVEAFADGFGLIHGMDIRCHTPLMEQDTDMDYPTRPMAGDTGVLGVPTQCLAMRIFPELTHTGILQRHTWGTGEGVN